MSPPEADLMDNDAFKNPEELYVQKIQESTNIGGVNPQVAVAAAKVTTQLLERETVAKKEEYKKEEAVKAELSRPKREGSKFGGKVENIAPPTTTVPTVTIEELNAVDSKEKEYTDPEQIKHVKGQDERQMMMAKLEASKQRESTVICCRNMITAEDLDDEFEGEIQEECEESYGKVNNVIVYQEKQSEEEDAETIVKVFIAFETHDAANLAKAKLHGRWFGGKQIQAHYYNMGYYEVNDLSH